MRTEVMTLGNVNAAGQYVYPEVGPGGMPGYGGPSTSYAYGAQEPLWLTNRMPVPPVSPQQPQNLLRPTYKGSDGQMSSTGKSVYALYGLGTTLKGASADEEVDKLRSYMAMRTLALGILGGSLAGVQLDRLNVKGGKFFFGVLAGVCFPLLANGGIWLWNR